MTTIGCRNINFAYVKGSPVLVDFTVHFSNEVPNYIVGPSGCGKTTLGLILAGALAPQSGDIINSSGHDITHVLQFPEGLFLTDKVEDEFNTLPHSQAEEISLSALACFGLPFVDIATKSPDRLSFGQKRLLAIAMQAGLGTGAIVLDEPTLGLDKTHLNQLVDWIGERITHGILHVIITHDLDLIRALPGAVHIIDSGVLRWQGNSKDFLSDSELLRLSAAI